MVLQCHLTFQYRLWYARDIEQERENIGETRLGFDDSSLANEKYIRKALTVHLPWS